MITSHGRGLQGTLLSNKEWVSLRLLIEPITNVQSPPSPHHHYNTNNRPINKNKESNGKCPRKQNLRNKDEALGERCGGEDDDRLDEKVDVRRLGSGQREDDAQTAQHHHVVDAHADPAGVVQLRDGRLRVKDRLRLWKR